MNHHKLPVVFVVLLLAAALVSVSAAAAQQETPAAIDASPESFVPPPWWNKLCNGSFETGTTNPDCWTKDSFSAGAKFKWDSTIAYDGTKSAKITLNSPNDARWVQTISVEPNTDYVLSGWIKTKDVQGLGGANLSINPVICTERLTGTRDWTFVKVIFNSGSWTEVTLTARLGMDSSLTTGTAWFDKIQLAPIKMLYVSSSQSGQVAGIKFAPGDILLHDPVRNTWAMYFDASDVGITKNVDAFDVIWTGTIMMSLSGSQNVAGLGQIKPQDLIFFHPTSTGDNTAGSFTWNWLGTGKKVGLDVASENVDAVEYISAFVISTSGATNAPGIVDGRDEDLFQWDSGPYYWHYRLHGSDVPGLLPEDVWGVSVDGVWGKWLLSTQDTYYPGDGRRFTNKQIFAIEGTTVLSPAFWSGPEHGFNYVLDGISLAAN